MTPAKQLRQSLVIVQINMYIVTRLNILNDDLFKSNALFMESNLTLVSDALLIVEEPP